MRTCLQSLRCCLAAGLLFITMNVIAQDVAVYIDSLTGGFQDWGWDANRNFNNRSPVQSGSRSIAVTMTASEGALRFQHYPSPVNPDAVSQLSFWINGGPTGGQWLRLQAVSGNSPITDGLLLAPLSRNTWQHYVVPLSMLGVNSSTPLSGFWLQDSSGGPQPTFYVDEVKFISTPPPSQVNMSVNPLQILRAADARWLGLNTAIWDYFLNTPSTSNALQDIGCLTLRCPAGSLSDQYHWAKNTTLDYTWQWGSSFTDFVKVATNAGVQTYITVNYGTGTPEEAAAWVAYANGSISDTSVLGTDRWGTNWQTVGYWASIRASAPLPQDDGMNFLRISRAAPLGFKYWEVGNECYGSWETDFNTNSPDVAHDGYTYARRFVNYYTQMKNVDPTIKVGIVATPDLSYGSFSGLVAFNPRTFQYTTSWTPMVLYALNPSHLNLKPDFLVHHAYPQYQSDSDELLLQAATHWATDADVLRTMIEDYFGPGAEDVELVVTENNADSGNQGRQSTSIVNGLYLADSLGQLMKTEFNGFIWWDLRNGADTRGDFNSALYGWRDYGDLGIMLEDHTRYPTYYAFKMMHHFVSPDDQVLSASSDYYLLSTYATRKSNGSLSLLVINKHRTATLNGQIILTNFVPSQTAATKFYGIPQDEAARTGVGSQDIATGNYNQASTNFSYTFPPYSLTLFTFAPGVIPVSPELHMLPGTAGQFVFQLQGQATITYNVQRSTDLVNWIPVSTHTLSGTTLNFTNPVAAGSQFWRAVVSQP